MSGMHYSKPAARRVLKALRRTGGSATSWELAAALRSVAVHSDVASLRVYARDDLGLDIENPVDCKLVDTRFGRRTYRYTLCDELREAAPV